MLFDGLGDQPEIHNHVSLRPCLLQAVPYHLNLAPKTVPMKSRTAAIMVKQLM
jgi:hypothetical protein